jgi:hypothetical protein
VAISLDKLQELFKLREEYSSKLTATERQIRGLVEGPEAQDSDPAPKKARKQRAETGNSNDMQKVTGAEQLTEAACSEAPGAGPDASVVLSAVSRVILSQVTAGSNYSGAELFQLTLDASGEGTDPEALKSDVKDCVRTMVQSGHLVKTGEAKGSRYSLP